MSPTPATADPALVSIIIPCYNCALYIARAIESALAQSYNKIEVIVMDDGSTDESLQIIKSYSPQIRYYSIPHQGAPTARNLGLKKARGEYIQFLDADDIMLKHKVAACLAEFADGIDAVYCRHEILGKGSASRREPGIIYRILRAVTHRSSPPSAAKQKILIGEAGLLYILNHSIRTPLPLHRANRLQATDGFTSHLVAGQEYDFHIKLLLSGAVFKAIPDVLIQIHYHDGADRISNNPEALNHRINLLESIKIKLEQTSISNTRLRRALAKRYLNYAQIAHADGKFYQSKLLYRKARIQHKWVSTDNYTLDFLIRILGFNKAYSFRNQVLQYLK